MTHKPAITSVPIHELIANRWSGRAFDQDKLVEKEHLLALIEAARWAPNCFNMQPWRYMIWQRDVNHESWQKAFNCLSKGNQEWAKNAPVLISSSAYSLNPHNQKPNRWWQHDTGAASENMCLQGVAIGLMVHQMGGFDPDALREAFGIPEEYQPMAMIAVGWPAPSDTLSGSLFEREIEERKRNPISEHFFLNEWGNGFA